LFNIFGVNPQISDFFVRFAHKKTKISGAVFGIFKNIFKTKIEKVNK